MTDSPPPTGTERPSTPPDWCHSCDSRFNRLTNTCRCNYR